MPYRRATELSSPISARQFLQMAERAVGLGTWAWEPATGVMVWSDAMHRLMRTDPATHTPTIDSLLQRTHPDDRWLVREKLRPGADLSRDPVRMVFADATTRSFLFHKHQEDGGRGTTLVGIVQDVTETRTAHDLLIQRQRLFDGLARLMGAIVWRAEPDGTPFIDNGWCELTGTTLAQNAGSGWLERVHPEDRARTSEIWKAAVAARSFYLTSYRVRRYDGAYCALEVKAAPLLDDAGAILEWLGYGIPVHANPSPSWRPEDDRRENGLETPHRPGPTELKAARLLAGMSVGELAAGSGVSVSTISRFEAGSEAVQIRSSNLLRLREALARKGIAFGTGPDGLPSITYRARRPAASGPSAFTP